MCQVYDFIANNWEKDDEIFFFGFSRGAYTVRSVSGLVSDIGVLSAVQMDKFPAMWAAYRANTDGLPFQKTEWYLKNHRDLRLEPAKIKVVGVYDTVGALVSELYPLASVRLAHQLHRGSQCGSLCNLLWDTGFPSTSGTPFTTRKYQAVSCAKILAFPDDQAQNMLLLDIEHAFQALAIDEKRLTFLPTLWHKTLDGPSKRLEQCWFPGVHGNIGGQADDVHTSRDREEIGHNTFAWMVCGMTLFHLLLNMLTRSVQGGQCIGPAHIRTLCHSKNN